MAQNNTSKMIYATAYTEEFETAAIRLKLNPNSAIDIDDRNWATGVKMEQCWFGKNRIITQAYSIWDDGNGCNVGRVYRIITDHDAILSFCDRAGIEPPNWIVAEEA